jgi:hypothetical protein
MNLVVVVAINLLPQYASNLIDVRQLLSRTGSHDPVLQPAIGSLDFTFCLGREGIDDTDAEYPHHLSPLRRRFIGLKHMFSPETVSSLDKTEYAQ